MPTAFTTLPLAIEDLEIDNAEMLQRYVSLYPRLSTHSLPSGSVIYTCTQFGRLCGAQVCLQLGCTPAGGEIMGYTYQIQAGELAFLACLLLFKHMSITKPVRLSDLKILAEALCLWLEEKSDILPHASFKPLEDLRAYREKREQALVVFQCLRQAAPQS